ATEAHELAMTVAVQLEALLLELVDLFARRGIEALVLKGPALAHGVYATPELRSFCDVDLLVRGRDFDAASRLLTARGCVAHYTEPRRNFTARFGKGVCHSTPAGFELDLHRSFVAGPFGMALDTEALFQESQRVEIAGVSVGTLATTDQLLHAAAHAVLG